MNKELALLKENKEELREFNKNSNQFKPRKSLQFNTINHSSKTLRKIPILVKENINNNELNLNSTLSNKSSIKTNIKSKYNIINTDINNSNSENSGEINFNFNTISNDTATISPSNKSKVTFTFDKEEVINSTIFGEPKKHKSLKNSLDSLKNLKKEYKDKDIEDKEVPPESIELNLYSPTKKLLSPEEKILLLRKS